MATYTKDFVVTDLPSPPVPSTAVSEGICFVRSEASLPSMFSTAIESNQEDAENAPDSVLAFTPPATYLDETADAADADIDDVIAVTASSGFLYVGADSPFDVIKIDITRAGTGTYIVNASEYWSGAGWVSVLSVGEFMPIDFKTVDLNRIAFVMPDGWAPSDVNSVTKYWIRVPVSAGSVGQQALAAQVWVAIGAQEYTKDFTESLALTDAVAKGFARSFADSLIWSDVLSIGWAKLFSELLSFSDTLVKNPGKILSDILNITEAPATSFAFVFAKNFAENVSLSEVLRLAGNLYLSDNLSISDLLVRASVYIVPFGDNLVLNDNLSQFVGFALFLSDGFAISDLLVFELGKAFGETLPISDNLIFLYAMTQADVLALSDSIVKSIGMPFSDLLSFADALYNALVIGIQLTGNQEIARILDEGSDEPWMTYVAIGQSDVPEDEVNDTALYEEIHRKLGYVWVVRNTFFIKATFGQDEPTGDGYTVREVGIFDDPVNGVLGRRWVLGSFVTKDNVDEVVVECAVTILRGTIESHVSAPTDTFGISDSLVLTLS